MSNATSSRAVPVVPVAPVAAAPWWSEPFMWMVVAGPLIVVVAGFATLAIAILNPDPIIQSRPAATASDLPAVQGRNHAATPSR